MQIFVAFALPFVVLAVAADAYALTGAVLRSWASSLRRLVAAVLRRCRRVARRVVAGVLLAAAVVVSRAALFCRRVAGALRGAAAGWRGVF